MAAELIRLAAELEAPNKLGHRLVLHAQVGGGDAGCGSHAPTRGGKCPGRTTRPPSALPTVNEQEVGQGGSPRSLREKRALSPTTGVALWMYL
jgi:hypothetical protein